MPQRCPLKSREVSQSECNACNAFYREMGVYPFLGCFRGHTFTVKEAMCTSQDVFCPTCRTKVFVDSPTAWGLCCQHISCKETCELQGNPNRCNMARDPRDARRLLPSELNLLKPPGMTVEDILRPNRDELDGVLKTVRVDGYALATRQINNQEALRVSEETLKTIGKKLSSEMLRLKLLHTGNAQAICKDIARICNAELRAVFPEVDVRVSFVAYPSPKVSITGTNSLTAWLLHEVLQHVSF